MSQFTQKYFKHHYVPSTEQVIPHKEESYSFKFWIKWGLFEWLVITLLSAILTLLYLQYKQIPLHTPQTLEHKERLQPQQSSLSSPLREKNITKEQNQSQKREEFSYSKNILPDIKKLKPDLEKEVSIKEYLYFADESEIHYPDFIDAKTHKLLESKKPKCFSEECPITRVTTESKKAYAKWLGLMHAKKYEVVDSNQGFKVKISE